MTAVAGHCLCNAIQFEVQGPEQFACFCYCNSCQRAAGAPLVAWATYDRVTFTLLRGAMRWHESSPGVTRGLCATCGSSISYENSRRPGEIDLSLNTLDDPSGPVLKAHIWTVDKPAWLVIGDDLPVYPKNIG